ncbi:hypothetical protein [Brevundimonas diminuta]|uniref:hypothetical protein n=1 Tax=Brevundimonas diminuta TaxID=293 RepID=UPI0028976DBA|nr:hypothetical protein [Brevundimonas diminuta]
MRQSRTPRPTLETAHSFHREGVFMVGGDHVSDEERMRLAREVSDTLHNLIKTEFPRTNHLEYAVLKSHLIIEHAITEYIRCTSSVLVELKDLRFSFHQKVEIAYLMGLGAHDPILLPSIERLNKIRNQAAHSFVLDRALVDEMLRINSEDYEEFKIRDDRDRIKQLRWLSAFMVGHISAGITVAAFWSSKSNQALLADSRRKKEAD